MDAAPWTRNGCGSSHDDSGNEATLTSNEGVITAKRKRTTGTPAALSRLPLGDYNLARISRLVKMPVIWFRFSFHQGTHSGEIFDYFWNALGQIVVIVVTIEAARL